jgi:formate dehydrogenase major subunit
MSEQVNIILNGKHIKADKNDYVLDVARKNGVEIPTLCNDPRLEPYSSCFVCVVEIEGMRGLQPSCSTRVTEGMKITTDNEKVRKSRKGALDLIMSNHYADCKAPCTETCPANVDVQGYISLIEKGLYSDAVALIKETNPLPAVCGRVCVRPCETACRRNLLDEGAPVGIDYMKRFAADWDLEHEHYVPEVAPSTGKKVAIIGAGPGGLSAAYFLQQKGHQCDIYEAAPEPGGWLRYGIPEYRLPNDVLDHEISTITELGVNIYCNKKLGDNISYKDLKNDYDSVILTIGAQKGTLLGVEGENAEGVYAGIDFLKAMEETGKPADFRGKKVVVVGGGNTAMDCCRTSIRCGSTDVKVVYRRTEKEMPANPIEIHESKLEGVEYLFLNNPVRVNADENGKLKSVTLVKMELGEPDASGRRRPIPVEGSEYDLECDYILAAIGQKTDADFIDDINKFAEDGKLELNRWGNIDADEKTLQTGIPSVFAAGDGVTGPATIIEAIAQAQKASLSAHQYMTGEEVKPAHKPFLSKKDNFKPQVVEDYKDRYVHQAREEMPVLPETQRVNFKEVELGYDEAMACNEAGRCLECGCVEYFDCDLQKYSDEYEVDQKKYAGEFNEYHINFDHPYLELDSNKCILCSRCIRICHEVVGADALGLVNRGFKTYVSPSMGLPLAETNCESCGLCIDACPTGALTENFIFKPGPVKVDPKPTIDNYGSEGVSMNLMTHRDTFVMEVTGNNGLVNEKGSIGRRPKFGYKYLNDSSRITKPMLRKGDKFEEISFDEALKIVTDKVKAAAEKTAVFAGARLSNEELYLLQKWVRKGLGTNNVSNFHYLGRGAGYLIDSFKNVPFDDLYKASKIYIVGAELIDDHDYAGFVVNNARIRNNIPVEMVSTNTDTNMKHKIDSFVEIKDYFAFAKAVNHYILANNLQNDFYLKDNNKGFEEYKKALLAEDFAALAAAAGLSEKEIAAWADEYINQQNTVVVFSEKYIDANTAYELYNMASITGKLGKTASGVMPLKEKNNSQGLFDMGAFENVAPGRNLFDTDTDIEKALNEGAFENILIFGEDPVGTAIDTAKAKDWLQKAGFVMVQDYFMTPTAQMADLILPGSFHTESDGSFTNTQQMILQFEKQFEPKVELTNVEQLLKLGKEFGLNGLNDVADVHSEALAEVSKAAGFEFEFVYHSNAGNERYFNYGCDSLMKYFDDEFENAFKK